MPDDEGLEDMADIDLSVPPPHSWSPEEDTSIFVPRDKDEDADG